MITPAESPHAATPRRGKKILRFFLWSLAAIFAFFVVVFISSRIATHAIWTGIEAQRATGLSSAWDVSSAWASYSPLAAQSFDFKGSSTDLQITRAASLALATRDFDSARERVESIVQTHHGYFDAFEIAVRQGSGRTLAATLRVPAEEFDPAFAELKTVGHAERESQASAESSAQSDRLAARLAASRATEERLARLTLQHSGKLGEYLDVEREIAKVRAEIEDLQAQQMR